MSTVNSELSDAEAALYDRQLRLWGLESQKRLRQSNILVAGLSGLGAEVAKNLILAGIKSITLLDHNTVVDTDCANFLSDHQYSGENKAEACRERAQELNPMVKVLVDTDDLSVKKDDFFEQFTAVCITGYKRETLVEINAACRKFGVKFFAGDTWGFNGYVFADLGQHSYLHERIVRPRKTSETGEPAAKKPHTEENIEITEKNVEYVPLEKALAVKSGKSVTGLAKRISPVFLALHVIFRFTSRNGRLPSSSHREKDTEDLIKLKEEVLGDLGIDLARLKDDFAQNVFGDLSPVCAVVGGILAQDIIKAVSGKGTPITNFFLFDAKLCTGVVERIGM